MLYTINIQPGDNVLCHQTKLNKLTTPYKAEAEPLTVTKVRSTMILADNKQHVITRDFSYFKTTDCKIVSLIYSQMTIQMCLQHLKDILEDYQFISKVTSNAHGQVKSIALDFEFKQPSSSASVL